MIDRAHGTSSSGKDVGAMSVRSMDDGDPELIVAAQRGERSALDVLVRRHDHWVRNVVYATVGDRNCVDDIVQRIWTNVWRQIGTLVEPERWRGWLYRMAKNAAIDSGLKNARERKLRVAFDEGVAAKRRADPAAVAVSVEEH